MCGKAHAAPFFLSELTGQPIEKEGWREEGTNKRGLIRNNKLSADLPQHVGSEKKKNCKVQIQFCDFHIVRLTRLNLAASRRTEFAL